MESCSYITGLYFWIAFVTNKVDINTDTKKNTTAGSAWQLSNFESLSSIAPLWQHIYKWKSVVPKLYTIKGFHWNSSCFIYMISRWISYNLWLKKYMWFIVQFPLQSEEAYLSVTSNFSSLEYLLTQNKNTLETSKLQFSYRENFSRQNFV